MTGYMTTAIFAIFCIVYLGMILGGLPFPQASLWWRISPAA